MELTALLVYIALVLIVVQCVLIGILWTRGGSSKVDSYAPHDGSESISIEIQALKMEIKALKGGTTLTGPHSPTAQNSGSDLRLPSEQQNKLQGAHRGGGGGGRPPPIVPAPAMNQFQPDFEMPAMALHAPTYETMSANDLQTLLVERDLGDLIEGVKVSTSPLRPWTIRSPPQAAAALCSPSQCASLRRVQRCSPTLYTHRRRKR